MKSSRDDRILVAGDGGVDGAGPLVDAAGEGLDVIEALLAEPHGYVEGAGSVVAEDDGGAVGVELLEMGGDVAHGDVGGAGYGGDLELPGFADVEQQGRGRLVALGGVGVDRDLGRKGVGHAVRIPGAGLEISGRGGGCSPPGGETVVHLRVKAQNAALLLQALPFELNGLRQTLRAWHLH